MDPISPGDIFETLIGGGDTTSRLSVLALLPIYWLISALGQHVHLLLSPPLPH